ALGDAGIEGGLIADLELRREREGENILRRARLGKLDEPAGKDAVRNLVSPLPVSTVAAAKGQIEALAEMDCRIGKARKLAVARVDRGDAEQREAIDGGERPRLDR